MAFFEPERYFARITRISVTHDIVERGFTCALLDMDNTILPRDTHHVPRDVSDWLRTAQKAGVRFCLLSNNFHPGVYEWAERLDLPIVAKAVKPLPHGFLMARAKVGGSRESTLVIGDQLATDVVGAHLLGMTAYMVMPLVEQDLKHTLLLRNVERVLMGDRVPEGAAGCVGSSAETPAATAGDPSGD